VFCRPGGSGIRPAAQPGTQLMPTPLPSDAEVNLVPPTAEETQLVIRGVLGAVAPADGPTRLQRELFAALSHSMTGHDVDTTHLEPLGPVELAEALAYRNDQYRTRISQLMLLGEMVLSPIPAEVSDRVDRYIDELSVSDNFVCTARANSTQSLGFAMTDFARNGYSNNWSSAAFPLHTSDRSCIAKPTGVLASCARDRSVRNGCGRTGCRCILRRRRRTFVSIRHVDPLG
jgi:hypothetical protein